MRVYHFLNEKFGLKDILERRLKISRIMELNDPFEFCSLELNDPDIRKKINQSKSEVDEISGLICFSNNWKSPVQWAHYADKHKGLCLGFDIDVVRTGLMEVEYVNERIQHEGQVDRRLVDRLFRTKHAHWAYEEEHRAYVELKDKEDDELYYIDFEGNIALKQVIIGANSDVTRFQLNKALGVLANSVETFKVRPSFKRFEMVKNQKTDMWV